MPSTSQNRTYSNLNIQISAPVVNTQAPLAPPGASAKGKPMQLSCNSTEHYLKNASVPDILGQISTITSENYVEVVRSLRLSIEAFSNDLRRAEANFLKAKDEEEVQLVVKSLQSIYRYHLLNRLGNVVSRVRDEAIKKAQSSSTTAPSTSKPTVTTRSETIDLTDDVTINTPIGAPSTTVGVLPTSFAEKRNTTPPAAPDSSTQPKRQKTLPISADRPNGVPLNPLQHNPPQHSSSLLNGAVERLVADAVAAAAATKSANAAISSSSSLSTFGPSSMPVSSQRNVPPPTPAASCWDFLARSIQGPNL